MKNIGKIGISMLIFIVVTSALGQTKAIDTISKKPIVLDTATQSVTFKASSNYTWTMKAWKKDSIGAEAQTNYYWLAFKNKLRKPTWKALDSIGVKYAEFTKRYDKYWVYRFNVNGNFKGAAAMLKNHPDFINLAPVLIQEKVTRGIWNRAIEKSCYVDTVHGLIRATVCFNKGVTKKEILHALQGKADTIEYLDPYGLSPHAGISATIDNLASLAELDIVKYVYEHPKPMPTMDMARKITLVDSLQYSAGFDTSTHPPSPAWNTNRDYTGDSVWIGIYDTGIDSTNCDFKEMRSGVPTLRYADVWRGRTPTWERPGDAHGSHVAGIAAGNGWMSHLDSLHGKHYQWRGVAPKALLVARGFEDAGHEGDVNNHSFVIDLGYYNDYDYGIDEYIRNHDISPGSDASNILVYATSNAGAYQFAGPQQGYYSVEACSKNGIKVGSHSNLSSEKSSFSSMGPTRDGRIGPDIMAPGAGNFYNEKWVIEIDSIQWKNGASNGGTVKKVWNFDYLPPSSHCDSLSWGCHSGGIQSLNRGAGNTTLCIVGPTDGNPGLTLFSDSLIPNQTAVFDDTLTIRYRISDTVSNGVIPQRQKRMLWCKLKWQSTSHGHDSLEAENVNFYLNMNVGWQILKFPLRNVIQKTGGSIQTDPAWATGNTQLRRLWLQFAGRSILSVCPISYIPSGFYSYQDGSGTSMAAPFVTGLTALMLQKYGKHVLNNISLIHDNPFWNSTARAILIHTATDMVDTVYHHHNDNPDFTASGSDVSTVFSVGPDWATGYGRVNAVKALQYVDRSHFLEDTIGENQIFYYTMSIPSGTSAFRVSLVWDDLEAAGLNNETTAYEKKLVNDLDLFLLPPNSRIVGNPWVLDHNYLHGSNILNTLPTNGIDSTYINGVLTSGIRPDSVKAHPAYKGRDSLNNVEVVDIANPAIGTWTIAVVARNIQANQSIAGSNWNMKQDFSLVFDFAATSDTSSGNSQGRDQTGLIFGNANGDQFHGTQNGSILLKGNEQPGTLSGLTFGSGASIDESGNLIRSSLYTDQGTWLDNPNNLAGGLVFGTIADNKSNVYIANNMTLRIRKKLFTGIGGL